MAYNNRGLGNEAKGELRPRHRRLRSGGLIWINVSSNSLRSPLMSISRTSRDGDRQLGYEARKIAANVAKLPELLLRKKQDAHRVLRPVGHSLLMGSSTYFCFVVSPFM